MNSFALVRTPRRFTAVTTTRAPTQSSVVSGSSRGKADVKAAIPAAIETATFNT